MSPRVQAEKSQYRLRTPRISFLFFQFESFYKALMKRVFLLLQGFFIPQFYLNHFLLIRDFFVPLLQLKHSLLRIVSLIYHICFPTSVY